MIHFTCSNCGVRLKSASRHEGKTITCQRCQEQLVIPLASDPIGEDVWRKVKDTVFGESRGGTGIHLKPHRGMMVLAFGLLSIFVGAGLVLGPIAWFMGSSDLKEMRSGRMDPGGEGMTQAGVLCGMVMTILHVLGILFACLIWAVITGVFVAVRRS